MRERPSQRGVTLVELLVTIILVAIFFALAVPLFVVAQKQSSGDRARVIAANVAQSKLETVRSVDYALLDEEGTYFTSDPGVDAGFGATWPSDEIGPVKVYSIDYDVEFVYSSDNPTEVVYKLVIVDVSWTPPPSPVKHVVFKTAIYPQYEGPEIVDMTVAPFTAVQVGQEWQDWLLQLPVVVRARVNSVDLSRTAYVRFAASATNGSFAEYADVTAPDLGGDGWFTWNWAGQGAGDGEYRFTAVAVSTVGRLGEYWKLQYMLDTGPPAAPELLESGVQAGSGVVSVHWSPPVPVAGDLAYYRVERSDGNTLMSFEPLNKASTTYIDRAVSNGTAYTYTVYAVDERRRVSDPSATWPGTPVVQAEDPTPLSAPSGLTAILVGQNVTLSWAANSAAEGVVTYRVYRDTNRTSPIAVIQTAAGHTTYSYMDPQIGWGVSHIYYVTAVDAALNESPEASTLPVTVPPAPPEQPFGLTVKVTGHDAIVMVASLVDGSVYDINGQRIVGDRSVSPILVKANQKQGVTFQNLPYSTYRVTVTFVDSRRNPIVTPRPQDVELVRNETIQFAF